MFGMFVRCSKTLSYIQKYYFAFSKFGQKKVNGHFCQVEPGWMQVSWQIIHAARQWLLVAVSHVVLYCV